MERREPPRTIRHARGCSSPYTGRKHGAWRASGFSWQRSNCEPVPSARETPKQCWAKGRQSRAYQRLFCAARPRTAGTNRTYRDSSAVCFAIRHVHEPDARIESVEPKSQRMHDQPLCTSVKAYRSKQQLASWSSSRVIWRYTDVSSTPQCPRYVDNKGSILCTSFPWRYQVKRRVTANVWRKSCSLG